MGAVHTPQDLEALEVAGMALLKLAKSDALHNSWAVQPQHQMLWERGATLNSTTENIHMIIKTAIATANFFNRVYTKEVAAIMVYQGDPCNKTLTWHSITNCT